MQIARVQSRLVEGRLLLCRCWRRVSSSRGELRNGVPPMTLDNAAARRQRRRPCLPKEEKALQEIPGHLLLAGDPEDPAQAAAKRARGSDDRVSSSATQTRKRARCTLQAGSFPPVVLHWFAPSDIVSVECRTLGHHHKRHPRNAIAHLLHPSSDPCGSSACRVVNAAQEAWAGI